MNKVVLIDDEPWILTGLEELLNWEAAGFKIVAKFTDPQVALEQIHKIKPDVVFTDIRMPKMSGIQLISSLREKDPDIEFVLISAYKDFEAACKALEYGVFQYILKPFVQEEVENTIRLLDKKITERNGPISINPDEPNNLTSPKIEQLFHTAARYPVCCLLLCDHLDNISLDSNCIVSTPLLITGESNALLLSAQSRDHFHNLISSIKSDPLTGAGFSRFYADFSTFSEMLADARCALNYGFKFSHNPLTSEIQLYLCKTTEINFTLSDLASEFYLSETYLSSMFKKNTGQTITSFIQNTKTFYAARLLINTDQDLKDIALQLGFADYSYFGKLFKRNFGQSPSSYREKVRKQNNTA